MARKTNKTASKTATATPVVETPATEPEAAPVVETEAASKKKAKTPKWSALEADRVAWIASHARPAVSPCLCGCGGSTKGRFMPGHDATLKESLKATDTDEARAALATFGW
jgi:hypothetical protein